MISHLVHEMSVVDFHVKKNHIGVVRSSVPLVTLENRVVRDDQNFDVQIERLAVCLSSFSFRRLVVVVVVFELLEILGHN